MCHSAFAAHWQVLGFATIPSVVLWGHMQRREFIGLLSGSAIGWPLVVHAQSATPIIGFFNGQTAANFQYLVAAFLRGLKEKGFVDGQNVTIEYSVGEWASRPTPGTCKRPGQPPPDHDRRCRRSTCGRY